jgi:non-ribosomal peptide synthetase component F
MSPTAPPCRPAKRPAFVPFDRAALKGSIVRRFEAQADAYPGRLALGFGEAAWTYEMLDWSANGVARALLSVREPLPGPVVLLIEQGPASVAAVLGVLKAGGVYIPLETTHPARHVTTVVKEAGAGLVLADAAGAAVAAEAAPGIPGVRPDPARAGGGPQRREGAGGAEAPAFIK